ncbi:hypothetical protein ACTFIR_010910 [Dictyostelium discoideum]
MKSRRKHFFKQIVFIILILIVNVNSERIQYSAYSEDDKSINITFKIDTPIWGFSYYYNPIQHLSIIKSIEPIPIIRNNIPFKCRYLLDKKGYQINLINLKDDFGENDFYNNIICNATSNIITENSIQLKGNDINTTYEFICIDDNDNINNNNNIDNIDDLIINSNNSNSNEIDKFLCLKNDLSNHTLCTYNSKYACLQSIVFSGTKIKGVFNINKKVFSTWNFQVSNIISINGFSYSIYLGCEAKFVGAIKSLNGIIMLVGAPFFREKLSSYRFMMGDNLLPISENFENDFQYGEHDNVLISMGTNQTFLNLTRYSDNVLKVQLEGGKIKEFKIDTQNKMTLSIEALGGDTKPYIQIDCESCIGARLKGLIMDVEPIVKSTIFHLDFSVFTLYGSIYLQSEIAPFETSNAVIIKPIIKSPKQGEVIKLSVNKNQKYSTLTVFAYYLPPQFDGETLFTCQFIKFDNTTIQVDPEDISSTNTGSYWEYSIQSTLTYGSGEFQIIINNFQVVNGSSVITFKKTNSFRYEFETPIVETISQPIRDGVGIVTLTGQNLNGSPLITIEGETSIKCGNVKFNDVDQITFEITGSPTTTTTTTTTKSEDKFYNVIINVGGTKSEPFLMNYLPSGWKCPNNCSGNGYCDGSLNCICNQGFSGYDCSMLINQVLTNANSLPVSTNQQINGSFSMTGNHLKNISFEISLAGVIIDSDTFKPLQTDFKTFCKDFDDGFTLDAKNSKLSISATAQFNPKILYNSNNAINYNGIYLDKLSDNSVYLKVITASSTITTMKSLKVIYKVDIKVNGKILKDNDDDDDDDDDVVTTIVSTPINNKILIKHLDSSSCLQIHASNRFMNYQNMDDNYASLVKMESITTSDINKQDQNNPIYLSINIPFDDLVGDGGGDGGDNSKFSLEVASTFSVFNEFPTNIRNSHPTLSTADKFFISFGVVVGMVLLLGLIFRFRRSIRFYTLRFIINIYFRYGNPSEKIQNFYGGYGVLNGKFDSLELFSMNGDDDDMGAPDGDDGVPEEGYIVNPYDAYDPTPSDFLVNEFIESKATSEID